MTELLEILDKRWRSACKVVFKQDIGPLSNYSKWLEGLMIPPMRRKSSVSGKEITYAIGEYGKNSKWISLDEIEYGKKSESLGINEIKDIDSLIAAVSEKIYYAGNLVLGNSAHVEKSSTISDSFYIYNSTIYSDCKYLHNCTLGRLCEDCFGTYGGGESTFCIRCSQTYRDHRCFELWISQNCSDCYYSYNLDNCTDCLFCFNAKNIRNAVGNLELEKSRYQSIKEKLLSEIVEKLKEDKKLPSLMEIAQKSKKERLPDLPFAEGKEQLDKTPVEREFSKVSRLLIGTELSDIDSYSPWLERHTRKIEHEKSAASGQRLFSTPNIIAAIKLPQDRMVTVEEAKRLGELVKMSVGEAETLSLSDAHEKIGKLAYFNVDFYEGTNKNIIECSTSISSFDSYRCSGTVYAKYCGYTFWPRSSEHAFGCDSVLDCSFCINCYWGVKLTRCFECDSCRSCSDCYFCHNCEDVHNSMFCFNAKNLNYAIGNVEVGREKYLQVKKMLLGEIASRLEKTHDCEIDIYNVGENRKKD